MSGHLSNEDHQDLAEIATLAATALGRLKAFEDRHGLDLTGPAMQALVRADVSLAFVPREIYLAEHYLDEVPGEAAA